MLKQPGERLLDLSLEQRSILELRMKMRRERGKTKTIVPRSRESPSFPLSFAQERLWFLHQLDPHSATYNVPVGVRLKGAFDPRAAECALSEIVRRHETLRTMFPVIDGMPRQVVRKDLGVNLSMIDLSELGSAEREGEAHRLFRDEWQRPFDLSTGPVWRVRLLSLGPEEHVFLYAMHHIISDGWSLNIFSAELSTLYKAFSVGKPSPLSELPIQYIDFAVWQREWLEGDMLKRQVAYWRKQLAGVVIPKLTARKSKHSSQERAASSRHFTIKKQVTDALKDLSDRQNATIFMTLLAALNTLFYRLTGQDDICIGTAIAGRNHTATEGLIGFFVNMLAIRTNLSGDPTFRALLERTRDTMLEADAHQDIPFEKIVNELCPGKDPNLSPFFQTALTLENSIRPNGAIIDGGSLKLETLPVERKTLPFELIMALAETGEGLTGSLFYQIDLFSQETVDLMLSCFVSILDQVATDPDIRLLDISLVGGNDQAWSVDQVDEDEDFNF
jgi:hypothetical protein